jgi:mono/diheme cytochrome c family protein
MKKIAIFFSFALLTISCNKKHKRSDILSASNLNSQFFNINPQRDTVLKTGHAAIIRIKKGTFGNAKQVSIEIKEAFRPEEILMAGLTTLSDGRPLRSAGMIYFNASVNGKKTEPVVPVSATIPAAETDSSMVVFKGEEKSDGTLNWVDPKKPDTTVPATEAALFEQGKTLFQGKCASCHGIFKNATGPSLRNVQLRGPWTNKRNLLAYINYVPKFMAGNEYARQLKSEYKSIMTSYPDLRMRDLDALLTYINGVKQEDDWRSGIPPSEKKDTISFTDTAMADCGYDTSYVQVMNDYPEYDTAKAPIADSSEDEIAELNTDELEYSYQGGYDFNITENGWYNIDAFLQSTNLTLKNVKLQTLLHQTDPAEMEIYVFVPTERIMQNGYLLKENLYSFKAFGDSIRLPVGYRALIFAVGSYHSKIVYGAASFTISMSQTIDVEIKETTKEKLKNLLYNNNLDGVEINAVERQLKLRKRDCNGIKKTATLEAVSNDLLISQ